MIQIERLAKATNGHVDQYNLQTGEFYECVECPGGYYLGWILYVVNIRRGNTDKVYGSWINHGPGVFSDITMRSQEFRFKKLNMKLVEVKE